MKNAITISSTEADMSRNATARTLPPGAVVCPECGSPDTPHYKWPRDPQSDIFRVNHPDTRFCVDCHHIWWND
jgi:hypothetical protein